MADVAVENAANDENDDNWLYGESNNEQVEENDTENAEETQPSIDAVNKNTGIEDKEQEEIEAGEGHNDDSHFNDEHFGEVSRDNQEDANGDADSQENGDSDSDDSDDVKVTIGEIKSGPQAYASLNIKRGVGLVGTGGAEKPRPGPAAGNKVTLEDLEGPGSINGVPALEFNIDTIEDKPWNKPGADISDYFNYGFNEVTWSAYCERQRRMRVNETGVGMHVPPPRAPAPDMRRPPGPVRHDEMAPGNQANYQNRENTIQVMTAERREYGRGVRDAPPEYFGAPPPDHYYPPPLLAYEEPWAGHAGHPPHGGMGAHPGHPEGGWAPGDIKELTPGPLPPPPLMGAPPPLMPHYRPPERHERDRHERDRRERDERHRHEDERDRDRDRDRSRSIKPDRIREKSYRRERSRSRSRRHKSRSRSPRPRERSRDRERERSPRPRERSRDRDRERERDRDRKTKTKETKEKEDEK